MSVQAGGGGGGGGDGHANSMPARHSALCSPPAPVLWFPCSFYLTPLLLPLLREMPAGKLGVDLTCSALQLVTLGERACGVGGRLPGQAGTAAPQE